MVQRQSTKVPASADGVPTLRIAIATDSNRRNNEILNRIGEMADLRLMSYWYIQDEPDDYISEYVKTGTYPQKPRASRKESR